MISAVGALLALVAALWPSRARARATRARARGAAAPARSRVACARVPHAELNGQSLYYEVHGEGEPLFIVMGLARRPARLGPADPRVGQAVPGVAIENRDVGRSSYASGPYDIADMADDTLALADHLGLDEFHLLGLSMGGAIAQEIALPRPSGCRTLTLVVTWGGSGPATGSRARACATCSSSG